ncbi:MAG: tannase/feruloyl esterase family alpha/beta hydrolase [Allosphingosinicella sp.]
MLPISRLVRCLCACLLVALAVPARAEPRDCASMAWLALDSVRIETAEAVLGGARWAFPTSVFNMFAGPNPATEAAFCRVAGVIEQEIRFEVWLPPQWNQRLLGVGNAGLTGGINYPALSTGIARGFATASTDTGHVTPDNFFDASWIEDHPDRVENFGRRAHHLLAETARRVVRAYYGRAPYRSYYDGCSSGGWQGLTEAQQFPSDYDGILAGAPANNFVRLQTRKFWLDALSRETPAGDLAPPQIALLSAAALAECDPADGVTDGIIGDPQGCRFDPAALLCREGQSEGCLTPAQAERARRIYGPARTPAGTQLYPGNAYGVVPFVVIPGVDQEPMLMKLLPAAERSWTPETFDPDRDFPALEARFGAVLGAWNPDLRRFRRGGGKLIVYHGWSDALLSPFNSVGYHQAVAAEMSPEDVGDFFRLFMVPGMDHCRGGPGTDRFDLLGALVAWVEQGEAPDRVVASGRTADGGTRTRPLCPHPQVARYDGEGDSDDAGNFQCVAPGAAS